jgi:hypothetical protein
MNYLYFQGVRGGRGRKQARNPKIFLNFTTIHGVTPQKVVLFIFKAERT